MNKTSQLYAEARKIAKAHTTDSYARNARLVKWGLK